MRQSKNNVLWHQCLCILLCYTIFCTSIGLQPIAQAAIDYSNLTRSNWGTVNTDIHYYYDENGSCTKQIKAVKDTVDPETTFIEKTVYEYNLQNRLTKVTTTPYDASKSGDTILIS